MGRKVWLWIIAGLAILLALAITAAIWLETMGHGPQQPEVPETAGTQQETGSETQESQEQQTSDAPAGEDTTDAAQTESTTTEQTEQATTEQTEPTVEWTLGEDQLPPF